MTLKPNKRSFSCFLSICLPVVVLTLLAGCFVYAFQHSSVQFSILSAVMAVLIFALIPFRRRLFTKQAEIDLLKQDYLEKSNLLESDIANEQRFVNSFRKKIINYSQLKGLTEQLSMCLYLDETSEMLSRETNKLFGSQETTVILYLFQSEDGELGLSSSQTGEMQITIKSKKGDIFDQWTVKTMQPLLIEDTRNDFRFDAEDRKSEDARPIRSVISVPLASSDRALGILRVDSYLPGHFSTDDLRLLRTVGDLGAVAIENAQLYAKLEDLAIRDSLTGLYLRRYLLDRMDEEIDRELRRGKHLSFLMIDLDDFKKYNDKFGHMAGDIVLKSIGKILQETFKKPGDLVCRYGGEEFSIVLPDCPKELALSLAEQVRQRIAKEVFTLRRQKTGITVSIGVATFPEDAKIKEELIQRADHALYRAKSVGRNRVMNAGDK